MRGGGGGGGGGLHAHKSCGSNVGNRVWPSCIIVDFHATFLSLSSGSLVCVPLLHTCAWGIMWCSAIKVMGYHVLISDAPIWSESLPIFR